MKRQPFFNKEGHGSFFSKSSENVTPFFSPTTIQTKLTIGQPNDKYEVEADAMADKVVQRLNSPFEGGKGDVSQANNPVGIQAKCSHCEQEEKIQKKEDDLSEKEEGIQRKPIFESNAEQPEANVQTKPIAAPVIQAKCSSCEEEEKLQKKEEEELPDGELSLQRKSDDTPSENTSGLESRLSSSKGGGSSLPSDIQSSMGSEFGADFSGVRVHTGTQAVQMSQDIGAQAFTHGRDIYFNQGKYDTNSSSGKHLLAHELTHTVQQDKNRIQTKKQMGNRIKDPPKTNIPNIQKVPLAAPIVYWGGRYLGKKLLQWGIRRALKSETDLLSLSAASIKSIQPKQIDLQGATKFDPSIGVAKHIQMFAYMEDWYKKNRYMAPYLGKKYGKEMTEGPKLNIKYGKMGHRKGVRIRYHIVTDTYEMKPQFFEIKHSAFDTTKRNKTTYIGLGVDKATSNIYGGMAFLPKGLQLSAVNEASMRFMMDENELTHLVFGDDYQKEKYTKVVFINEVKSGKLVFELAGFCDTGGGQQLQGVFVSWNDLHGWSGKLNLDVNGLEKTEMPIERDPLSKLLGKLGDIQLEKSWNFNNIKVNLKGSYLSGLLEIRGNAKYKPKKDEGSRIKEAELTLLVTSKEKAWDEVKKQLPENEGKEALHLPSLEKSVNQLSVVGWGSVSLSIVKDEKGKDVVTGRAALVVDPDGHLTVFGTIRVESQYKLMEEKGIDWKPISPKLIAEFGPFFVKIPGIPAGLNFTGKGGLYYKYMFGPISLYDIHIDGIYSTNSKINKELSVSARLNLSAELNGKVGLTGRMAARVGTSFPYLGVDISAVELKVDGIASLKGYSDFGATFGKREQTTEDGKVMRDFIKGNLLIAGELSLGLQGKLDFEVLYGSIKDKVLKGNWPIANTGISIDFDYNIGDEISKDKLEEIIKLKKTQFDRKKFVKGVLKDKLPKETKSLKGGFIDETGKKMGEVSNEPIPIPEETITPVKVKDDFNMDGVWHYLEIEIGAPGQDVVLKMATTPEILLGKLTDHRKATEILLNGTTDKQEQKRLKQMLADLKDLQGSTTSLIIRLTRMGIDPEKSNDKSKLPGFEALGDQIADFGRRYGLSDFGNPLAGDPNLQPSREIGDGSYDYPITIRWTKRSWNNLIELRPKETGWTRKGKKPPPAEETYADMDSIQKIEVAPTQYLGKRYKRFPGQEKTTREGDREDIILVKIGVVEGFKPEIDKKLKRVSSRPKRKGMEGRFKTLLKNYNYDWDTDSPDHVQDLGWDGSDSVDNLWPLYRDMNSGIANKIYNQTVEYIEDGEMKTNQPRFMVGKWFIIKSWGDIE